MQRWEDILNQTREALSEIFPEARITGIDLEGPRIVVYTKDMEMFAENPEGIKKIAQRIRRRISVRLPRRTGSPWPSHSTPSRPPTFWTGPLTPAARPIGGTP